MNSLRTMTIEEHDRPSPLPKPARVERWQKWREDADEYVVAEVNDTSWPTAYFTSGPCCCTSEMMASATWTFLGYAKPDKVEVGQRWKFSASALFVVTDEPASGAHHFLTRYDGMTGDWWRTLEDLRRDFEYLGMAESGPSIEQANAYASTDTPLANAFRKYVPDPKAEARRANEEAAKRLIANPPEWAYPTAWMCAVLAAKEWLQHQRGGIILMDGNAPVIEAASKVAHERRARHFQWASERLALVVYDAYARGMKRPPPLMARQGVKGGISTCDMGEYYE